MKIYIAYQAEKEPGKYLCCVAIAREETELSTFFQGMNRAHFFKTYEEAENAAKEWYNLLPENRKYKCNAT